MRSHRPVSEQTIYNLQANARNQSTHPHLPGATDTPVATHTLVRVPDTADPIAICSSPSGLASMAIGLPALVSG